MLDVTTIIIHQQKRQQQQQQYRQYFAQRQRCYWFSTYFEHWQSRGERGIEERVIFCIIKNRKLFPLKPNMMKRKIPSSRCVSLCVCVCMGLRIFFFVTTIKTLKETLNRFWLYFAFFAAVVVYLVSMEKGNCNDGAGNGAAVVISPFFFWASLFSSAIT